MQLREEGDKSVYLLLEVVKLMNAWQSFIRIGYTVIIWIINKVWNKNTLTIC